MSQSAAQLRRRFLVLTAMRWFPGGLLLPVLVLLLQARGIALSTIGVLFAVFTATSALAEVPTGGLADALGRKAVLLAGSVLVTVALVGFAVARSPQAFAIAFFVFGIGRSLSSGPLQAWYVDAVQAEDPAANLRPGLSLESTVTSVAVGSGSLIGGVLPGLASKAWPDLPTGGTALLITLTVPVWTAAGLLSVATLLIWRLMTSPRRTSGESGETSERQSVRGSLTEGLLIARRDSRARAVLLAVTAGGIALAATEILAPLHLAQLASDRSSGAATYGALVSGMFLASAIGSAAAPALAAGAHGSMRGAALASLVGAACYATLGLAAGIGTAVVAYLCLYTAAGASDPLRLEQLHLSVTARERATMVSVESTALMLGGVVAPLTIPAVVERGGFAIGWFVCGAALVLAALFTVGLRDRLPQPAADVLPRSGRGEPSRKRPLNSPGIETRWRDGHE